MKTRRLGRALLFAAVLAASLAGFSRTSHAQYPFTAKAGPVTLQLWIPDGVPLLKGVMAFSSVGLDKDWPGSADFRDLAKRIETGVVYVTGADPFGSYAARCTSGAFKNILDGLTMLGAMSKHPELANAPIVGAGHSHGGDYWNYFNACYPERTALVFCKSSGGVQYTGAALKTPMIWEIGMNDLKDHIGPGHFRGQMFAHRIKGSQLALVLGPGETHGQLGAAPRAMVITLIEAFFKLRVPADADGTKGPIVLNVINEDSGSYWLGDNYTKEIGAYPTFPGRTMLQNTSFLPSEDIAKMWAMVGDKLPADIKIESNGVCSGCYAHPASEPPLSAVGVPPDGGAPPVEGDAGAPGDDAGAATDDGGTGTEVDADSTGSGGNAGSSAGASGSSTGGAGGSSSEPTNTGSDSGGSAGKGGAGTGKSGGGTMTGGCSFAPGGGADGLVALMGAALFGLAFRRRRR